MSTLKLPNSMAGERDVQKDWGAIIWYICSETCGVMYTWMHELICFKQRKLLLRQQLISGGVNSKNCIVVEN